MDLKYDFQTYWDLIKPDATFTNRRAAAEQAWDNHPEKHKAIIRWLKQHGAYPARNPFFFIQDFQIKKARQERPQLSYNDYYRRYGTTEECDGWQRIFLPEEQRTIYVRN